MHLLTGKLTFLKCLLEESTWHKWVELTFKVNIGFGHITDVSKPMLTLKVRLKFPESNQLYSFIFFFFLKVFLI